MNNYGTILIVDDNPSILTALRYCLDTTFSRILTLDKDTLTDLAVKGYFVNSRSIMKRCAEDPNFISDFLCGQNPYALLVPEAEKIQISSDPLTDRYADSEIKRLLDAYLAGDILTPEELKEQFVIGMEELLGLS